MASTRHFSDIIEDRDANVEDWDHHVDLTHTVKAGPGSSLRSLSRTGSGSSSGAGVVGGSGGNNTLASFMINIPTAPAVPPPAGSTFTIGSPVLATPSRHIAAEMNDDYFSLPASAAAGGVMAGQPRPSTLSRITSSSSLQSSEVDGDRSRSRGDSLCVEEYMRSYGHRGSNSSGSGVGAPLLQSGSDGGGSGGGVDGRVGGAAPVVAARPMLGAARHGVVSVLQLYLCSDDDGPRVQTMCLEEARVRRVNCVLMDVGTSMLGKPPGLAGRGGGGVGGSSQDLPAFVGAAKPDTASVGLLRVLFDLLEVRGWWVCCACCLGGRRARGIVSWYG